jgi:hypothetical protein
MKMTEPMKSWAKGGGLRPTGGDTCPVCFCNVQNVARRDHLGFHVERGDVEL